MSELRVGVVGMGVGQLHLLCWLEVTGARAVAIVEADPARRAQAAAAWGLEAYATLDELLAAGVDVVDLCTPPAQHEAQILHCLDAGAYVICEKPLVDSLAACDRLAAHHAADRLMPILQYRYGPGAARARALVDAGLTGRLFTASAATWWRRDADYYQGAPWRSSWQGALGGTVVNHAVHLHDLLTWIGGPLVEVSARTATRVNDVVTEDCAVGIGRTADGALVTMNVTTGAAVESSRLAWCFEHVQIESSTDPYHPGGGEWTFAFRDADVEARAQHVFASLAPAPESFAGQFQAFVDGVGSGTLPVHLDDARAALDLVTAWYASARSGSIERLPVASTHGCYDSWLPEQHGDDAPIGTSDP